MPDQHRSRLDPVDYLVAAHEAETLALEYLLQRVELTVVISNLIHAIQRERGASGLFAASRGERFVEQRETLIRETGAWQTRLERALERMHASLTPAQAGNRLLSRLAYALHLLGSLPALRGGTSSLEISVDCARHQYTEVIQALLAIVFETADTAPDPEVTRALVAMFHFMQGKELAGQERALGAARLASGDHQPALAPQLAGLIDGQRRCLEIFEDLADPDSLDIWRHLGDPAGTGELERFRRMISLPPDREGEDCALSETWFDCTTRRIDAMKQVEDALEQHLHVLSEKRLDTARQALAQDRSVIRDKDTPEMNEVPSLPLPGQDPNLVRLLHDQNRRLQTMQEELEQARAALAERKLVDRAKALLMKHRGLNEDDAYRLLRKMAMNQNRRIGDIARTLLAMSDILK